MTLVVSGFDCGLTECRVQGHSSRSCAQAAIANAYGQSQRISPVFPVFGSFFDVSWSFSALTPGTQYQLFITVGDICSPNLVPDEYALVFTPRVLPYSGGELIVTTRCMYTLTILDADKEKAAFKVWKENASSMTLTELLIDVEAYIALVEDVVDGKIIGYSITVKNAELTGKSSPVANSEIERTGLLTFNLENSIYTESVDIPTFSVSFFDLNAIDLSATEVAALTTELTSGAYVNQEGQLLDTVKDGVKTFRKHRKQTKRARGTT